MKNIKLTKLGKAVVTTLIIILSVMVYLLALNISNIVSDKQLMEVISIACWTWLLAGQFITYSMIWK